MRIFAQNCIHSAKFGIFTLFATLGPKGRLLRKSALFRPHAADAYKTNGKLMIMEPLLAQKRFWAKKSISAPEIGFWAQKANSGQKWDFGPKKPFIEQNCEKVNDGLRLADRESGFPDSGPDSIHGRPGLRKHVAFSVPLHSNYTFATSFPSKNYLHHLPHLWEVFGANVVNFSICHICGNLKLTTFAP